MGQQFGLASAPQSYPAAWRSVQYVPLGQVVLRKMLRAVEALPLSADDVHLTRSAHGTFGDILQLLSYHSDLEVRPPVHRQQMCTERRDFRALHWINCCTAAAGRLARGVCCDQVRTKSTGLLRQYPMSACTRPVVRGSGSLAGAGSPASGEPLAPVPHQPQWQHRQKTSSADKQPDGFEVQRMLLACRRLLRWRSFFFGSVLLHRVPLVWRRPAAATAVAAA